MKKLIALLAVCTAGLGLHAQDEVKPVSSYSVTADFQYASKYVFRGVQQSNDAVQGSVEIASQGLYAGAWSNQSFSSSAGTEYDFYVGYSAALNKMWKVDFGATMYYHPDLGVDEHRTSMEIYGGIVGSVNGFTPAVYLYHDFNLKTTTVQPSLGYSFKLTPKASLDITGTVGDVARDSGPDYYYYGAGIAVPYRLTDRLTVTAGVNYASQNLEFAEKDLVWFTVGVSYAF